MISFKNYEDLLNKVDDKFQEILRAKPEYFSCKKGCHACCKPGLTVSVIEKEYIKKYFARRPLLINELKNLKKSDPHQGARCEMLNNEGECVIYEVRPIICRSHGSPILFPDEEKPRLDVCPLNFKGENLEQLEENLKINISILNTILALVNIKEFPESNEERFGLTVDEITL